jgi:hypothetical protein
MMDNYIGMDDSTLNRAISGKRFNRLNESKKYVMLCNKSCVKNNISLEEGLNIDPLFSSGENFSEVSIGLCFYEYKDIVLWLINDDNSVVEYQWAVTIPNDSRIITMYKKIYATNYYLEKKQLYGKMTTYAETS